MQAVADALSLLANIVMAWNTAKMQESSITGIDAASSAVPPEPHRAYRADPTEGINLRGERSSTPSGPSPKPRALSCFGVAPSAMKN